MSTTTATNTKVVQILCENGWKPLYEPILKKIIEFDQKQTDESKCINLTEISRECGLLAFKIKNHENIPNNIKEDIFRACQKSSETCEYCGTQHHVGVSEDYKESITCCSDCWMKHILPTNKNTHWTLLSELKLKHEMEETKSTTTAVATVEDSTATSSAQPTIINATEEENDDAIIDSSLVMPPPVMILFAEFLGYVSPLVDYADKLCDGKPISDSIRKAMKVDAKVLYNMMREEYTNEELINWFTMYYEAYLANRIEKLQSDEDDLPF